MEETQDEGLRLQPGVWGQLLPGTLSSFTAQLYATFQPMIQYINKKEVYGPFMSRQDVYLPHAAEVTSDKYTNM